jgi:inorganic pyrophosphatase
MNLYSIPTHVESPDIVNAIIEVPKGTSTKYEYDVNMQLFRLDRCLASAMVYTANYGFIPSTLADDGDPLDALVFNAVPIERGTLVQCRPVGVLDMTDDGKKDYKVLMTPISHIKQYTSLDDIDPVFLRVTRNFFQHYKDLDNKHVVVGDWLDTITAKRIITDDTLN